MPFVLVTDTTPGGEARWEDSEELAGIDVASLGFRKLLTFTGAGVDVSAGPGDQEAVIAIPGGSEGVAVEDEGVPLAGGTPFSSLNFTGLGVTATVGAPGVADVDIPGGTTGVGVEDEGVPVPNGPFTIINFIGGGVVASDGGAGVADVLVPGGGGGASTLADTLAAGDNSGPNDIEMDPAQAVRGEDNAAGPGGVLNLRGGDAGGGDFDGANVELTPGQGAGAGTDGIVRVNGDARVTGELVTGDLTLMSADGSAHWTLIEQPDHILVINNNTGQRFRLALVEESS